VSCWGLSTSGVSRFKIRQFHVVSNFLLSLHKESSHIFFTLLPDAFYLPPQAIISIGLALFVIPLSVVHSLSAKPVVYATWASIAAYVLWLACACYAHTRGSLVVNRAWLPVGSLWQGTSCVHNSCPRMYLQSI
jgi:hypothetical protein